MERVNDLDIVRREVANVSRHDREGMHERCSSDERVHRLARSVLTFQRSDNAPPPICHSGVNAQDAPGKSLNHFDGKPKVERPLTLSVCQQSDSSP